MSTINIENPARNARPCRQRYSGDGEGDSSHPRGDGEREYLPAEGGLRLGVQGGGCSGLSYNIRFDTQPRERDRIFQFDDVRIFVDPKSFIYLHGMVLDYEETLMHQGFVFQNPNAKKSCGCGTSFS